MVGGGGLDLEKILKICHKCGEEKDKSNFHKNKNRSDGLNGFCKNCMKEYKYPNYHKNRYTSSIGKFSHYKQSAKERNIPWELPYNDFLFFWKSKCFYCGAGIDTIGIDRVNNKLGYEMKNVVACCKTCNYAKGTLTWLEWDMYRNQLVNYISHGKIIFVEFNVRVDSLLTQYGNYQRSANRRGIKFDICVEDFSKFYQVPCYYCGIIFNTVGIDRVNNNEGYVLSNLVSCCKICNRAKGNLSIYDWGNWIDGIFWRTNEKKKS